MLPTHDLVLARVVRELILTWIDPLPSSPGGTTAGALLNYDAQNLGWLSLRCHNLTVFRLDDDDDVEVTVSFGEVVLERLRAHTLSDRIEDETDESLAVLVSLVPENVYGKL